MGINTVFSILIKNFIHYKTGSSFSTEYCGFFTEITFRKMNDFPKLLKVLNRSICNTPGMSPVDVKMFRGKDVQGRHWGTNLTYESSALRRLKGYLVHVCQHLKGDCQKGQARLLLVLPSTRTRGNKQKLTYRKYYRHMRKSFFKCGSALNRLLSKVVDFPSMEIIQDPCGPNLLYPPYSSRITLLE